MSSFIRTIARTVMADKHGKTVKSARRHFGGRGSKLGTTNPRDPCRDRKFKAKPKCWRSKANAPVSKPARKFAQSTVVPAADHKAKMARKAQARAALHQQDRRHGHADMITAGINRRTGEPHKHAREIARRKAQAGRA